MSNNKPLCDGSGSIPKSTLVPIIEPGDYEPCPGCAACRDDEADIASVKQSLAEIKADPSRLISGEALQKRLDAITQPTEPSAEAMEAADRAIEYFRDQDAARRYESDPIILDYVRTARIIDSAFAQLCADVERLRQVIEANWKHIHESYSKYDPVLEGHPQDEWVARVCELMRNYKASMGHLNAEVERLTRERDEGTCRECGGDGQIPNDAGDVVCQKCEGFGSFVALLNFYRDALNQTHKDSEHYRTDRDAWQKRAEEATEAVLKIADWYDNRETNLIKPLPQLATEIVDCLNMKDKEYDSMCEYSRNARERAEDAERERDEYTRQNKRMK